MGVKGPALVAALVAVLSILVVALMAYDLVMAGASVTGTVG